MKNNCRRCIAMLLLVSGLLAGCASTSVQPVYEQNAGGPPPSLVLIYSFAINPEEVTPNRGVIHRFREDREGKTPLEQKRTLERKAQSRLADDLVSGISQLGLSAQLADHETTVPPEALLITGQFIDVDEGNRARRLMIGLGAGEATIDTRFQVIKPTADGPVTIAEFVSHAASGEIPGATLTMGAGAAIDGVTAELAAADAGVGGIKTHRSSLDPMIDRTAKKIVAQLSRYFASQGWIVPD